MEKKKTFFTNNIILKDRKFYKWSRQTRCI